MQNLPQQQEDFINDPNMLLAIAMVKSISALKDGQGSSSEGGGGADDSGVDASNFGEQSIGGGVSRTDGDQNIEVNPIMDLIEKLEFKKSLSLQEVSMLTTCCLSQFQDNLTESHLKTKEFLTLLYYFILNASNFTLGKNYLGMSPSLVSYSIEHQAYSKLCKEALNLSKKMLEILAKKESTTSLFNSWLPPILKVMGCLHSKNGFNAHYSRYMKQSMLRIDYTQLMPLNEYIFELVPLLGAQRSLLRQESGIRQPDDKIINLQGHAYTEDDNLDKMLDYIPSDYQTLSNLLFESLNLQVQHQKATEEEVKGESISSSQKQGEGNEEAPEFKDTFQVCREYITSSKILETYSKALDRLAHLSATNESLLELNTILFAKVYKSIESFNIKQKPMSTLLSTELEGRSLKILSNIVKIINQQSESMEIENNDEQLLIMNQNKMLDATQIKENFQALAKAVEILQSVYSHIEGDKIKGKILKTFEEIVNMGEHFKCLLSMQQYNDDMMKNQDLIKATMGLINAVITHIFIQQQEPDPKKLKEKQLPTYLITLSVFWTFITKLDKFDASPIPPKSDKNITTAPSLNQPLPSNVRTRGQLKKEQTPNTSAVKGEAQQNLVVQRRNQSQAKKEDASQSSSQASVAKKDKQTFEGRLTLKPNLGQYTQDGMFKNCLSCFVVLLPKYLKLELTSRNFNELLINNILELCLNAPPHTSRLVQGIVSQFVNPAIKYHQEIQDLLINQVMKKIERIPTCRIIGELLIKLIVLFKRQDINERLGIEMVDILMPLGAGQSIKSQQDLYFGKQFNKYMVFLSVILNADLKVKQVIINEILKRVNCNDTKLPQHIGYLHMISLCLLKDEVLKRVKPVLFQYITKSYNEKTLNEIQLSLQSELDKVYSSVFNENSKEDIFNTQLLGFYQDQLTIIEFIKQVRKGSQASKTTDQKLQIVQVIRMLCLINRELAYVNEKSKVLIGNGEPNVTIFKLLLKDLLQNDVDINSKLLIAAKLDKDTQVLGKFLASRYQTNKAFNEEDLHVIGNLFEAIKQVAQVASTMSKGIFQAYLNKDLYKEQDDSMYEYLFNCLNLDIQSSQITNKVLSCLEIPSAEDKAQIHSILEPISNAKNLHSISTSTIEDSIYSHCLFNTTQIEIQQLYSTFLLYKQLFTQLNSVLNLVPLTEHMNEFTDIGTALLQMKYYHRYLEHPEGQNSIDNDTNMKLVKRVTNDKIANREFLLLRHLDKLFNILSQSNSILSQHHLALDDQSETKKLLVSIAKDALVQISSFSSLKALREFQALTSYFQCMNDGSEGNASSSLKLILKQSNRNTVDLMWDLAMNQNFEAQVEQVDLTHSKKGGMQLVISFNDKAPSGRKSKKEVSDYAEEVEMTDAKEQSIEKKNCVAEKFLVVIIELLQKNESLQDFQNQIPELLKQSLLHQTRFKHLIAYCLSNSQQTGLIKKLIRLLLSTSDDQQLKGSLQKFVYNQVVELLHEDFMNDDQILECIKLIQILFEKNDQISAFIKEQVLKIKFKSNTSKLIVIDFLFQLCTKGFSKLEENGNEKYSEQYIKEQRQKIYDEQQASKQAKLLSKKHDQDECQDDVDKKQSQSSEVEGFKKEKFLKDDSFYDQYMEKPENFCTYQRTKKDFLNQHWYFCYTCGLVGSNGCCAVCARRCHAGHHVVYSRKSNFFCDCGDGGKCISLADRDAESEPRQSLKRDVEHKSNIAAASMMFKKAAMMRPVDNFEILDINKSGGGPGSLPFGKGLGGIFSGFQPSNRLFNPFIGEDDHDADKGMIFKRLDEKYGGFPPPPEGIFSESSDEDQNKEQVDDQFESKDGFLSQHLKNMRGLMRMIKDTKQRLEDKMDVQVQRMDSLPSSQFTNINPLEDPLSEMGTPAHTQSMVTDRRDSFNTYIADEASQVREVIKEEKECMDQVVASIVDLMDQIIGDFNNESDMQSDIMSPRKKDNRLVSVATHQKHAALCIDLVQTKKHFKEETFKNKVSDDRDARTVFQQNLNLLSQIDCTPDGLVAMGEGQALSLYASSSFFEDAALTGYDNSLDNFPSEQKEGVLVQMVDQHKLSFRPLNIKFNRANQNFVAIAGYKEVEVATLSKKGRVVSKLSVDLMLEAFGKDLSITNIEWLPESQTMLAIATRQFVRIYDLSEDNISPKYNLMLLDDSITDFTFTKPQMDPANISSLLSYIIVGSKNGLIYYEEISYSAATGSKNKENTSSLAMENNEDNSQIILSNSLRFNSSMGVPVACSIACLSVFYCNALDSLIFSYEGSKLYIGKLDTNSMEKDVQGVSIESFEDKSSNNVLKAIWQKNGENLVCFKELGFNNNNGCFQVYLSAFSRRSGANSGLPVLLRITENTVDINILKPGNVSGTSTIYNQANGVIYVRNSFKSSKAMRLVSFYDEGFSQASLVPGLMTYDGFVLDSNIKQQFKQAQLHINKSELPKEVLMPVNFFEKLINANNNDEVKAKVSIQGDIASYFKGKSVLENISKFNATAPQIQEASKKAIKMILKLDLPEYMFSGLRVKLDATSKGSTQTSIKLLNRVVKLQKTKGPLWYEIPFCDIEVIYGTQGPVEVEFMTEDPKTSPLRIYAIEVFVVNKKDFNFKEKNKALEKLLESQNSSKDKSSAQKPTNEQLIQRELLKSQGIPLLSWEEKNNLFRDNNSSIKHGELVLALDILQQIISSDTITNMGMLTEILEKLKSIFRQYLFSNENGDSKIRGALKRCIKTTIRCLGSSLESLSYSDLKSQLILQIYADKVHNNEMDYSQIKEFIKNFSKLYQKRPIAFLKCIEGNPELVQILCNQYLRLFKHDEKNSNITKDVSNLISLIIAQYIFQINQVTESTLGYENNVGDLILNVYKNKDLSSVFKLIQPFLLHQNEQIQKVSVSKIMHLTKKYAKSQLKIIRTNQLPFNIESKDKKEQIIITDFTPHMLQYLLLDLLPSQQSAHDVIYSLSYKLIKSFEMIYSQFQICNNDLIDFIVEPLSQFIGTVIPSVGSDVILYDAANQNQQQFVYANLVFVNMLLQAGSKDEGIKMKESNLGLSSVIKNKIIEQINSQGEISMQLINWTTQIAKIYDQGFRNGKCSFRQKIEDGIAIQTYEAKSGQNHKGGVGFNLLKPQFQQSPWKWHPLFTNIHGMFELLDRKVPSQILIFSNLLLSDLNQEKRNLIQEICQLSQSKPANKFLKTLGTQIIRGVLYKNQILIDKLELTNEQKSLLDKEAAQLQTNIKFDQYINDIEILYNKQISKKQQLSFNMQFCLHKILQKFWKNASQYPSNWKSYLQQLTQQRLNIVYEILFESSFHLNEDSSTICLALASLGLEFNNKVSQVKIAYDCLQADSSMDVRRGFISSYDSQEHFKYMPNNIEIEKLINILLLGKNKKQQRVMAAHLAKGLYQAEQSLGFQSLLNYMVSKIPDLKQYGINSQEFLAVLSSIVNDDLSKNDLVKSSSLLDQHQQTFISKQLYSSVEQVNTLLVSHPNLELYSTLQKVCSGFQDQPKSDKSSYFSKLGEVFGDSQKSPVLEKMIGEAKSRKQMTNPYILEIEACTKCYEQKSLPFTMAKLNELKSETKFTDSCILIKFAQTQIIKQVIFGLHEVKGVRAIKLMNLYVNNKQGVDLAEMRNNWSYWKRVKQIPVELGKKNIDIEFPLPVYATNILVEFQTITLAKPQGKGERSSAAALAKHQDKQSKALEGVDNVIALLPNNIAKHCSYSQENENGPDAVNGFSLDKEMLACPRCGKQVAGKNGICNSCGENALQCTFCRNINYEKLDAFLCNECGLSRFAKFEFSFYCKQGFAIEKIENEDQKNNALSQIETNLTTAQSNYQALMKKRSSIENMVKKINEASDSVNTKALQDMFTDECHILYHAMMKSLNIIKTLKIEINNFNQGNSSLQEQSKRSRAYSLDETIVGDTNQCFSCTQELLKSSLGFIEQTSAALISQYKEGGFLNLLYRENLKMYSQSLQTPARKAICIMLMNDQAQLEATLKNINRDIFSKKLTIPAHLLSQNLVQEPQLLLDLLDKSLENEEFSNSTQLILTYFWSILFTSLDQANGNAAIAEQITGTMLQKIREYLKFKSDPEKVDIKSTLKDKLVSLDSYLINLLQLQKNELESMISLSILDKNNAKVVSYFNYDKNKENWLIQCLILRTSVKVRDESKDIISTLCQYDPSLCPIILEILIHQLDKALAQEQGCCDQYFDTLAFLLTQKSIKENNGDTEMIDTNQENSIYVSSFKSLLSKIDSELSKLIVLEKQKEYYGNEGFMPSIGTGQNLQRLVNLITSMVKESEFLKTIIKSNVLLVIKSFLKIRKLNLIKNKIVQNCEMEIEKMFKELHSEKDDEKENFILECIVIIESGHCDSQEQRFLFEEICRVINPTKPDPIYYLNLNKAQTQEFFIRGKMSKNPYQGQSLGSSIGDVRAKICKELELAEPELIELLVANKIVGTALSIKSVYEQVWWPYVCKQKNPDEYDIPNIDEAPQSSLVPMNVTYRLAGIDGEAQEDRVETLNEGDEDEGNQQQIEKKFQVTKALLKEFESKQSKQSLNGIKVLVSSLKNITNLQLQRYQAEWLFKLITYAIKIKENRLELLKSKHTISLLANKLFESVGLSAQTEGGAQKGQTLFDQILIILESLVMELNLVEDDQNKDDNDEPESRMEIDTVSENQDAATHVELFIQIIEESCNEMINNHQQLEKTSRKIKALSKILSFLISKEDRTAIQIIVEFIINSLSYQRLDSPTSSDWTNQDKFKAQFYLERVIELIESTPVNKTFLKDEILSYQNGEVLQSICSHLNDVSMVNIDQENEVYRYRLANKYILKFLIALIKNHPPSQVILNENNLLLKMYNLSQARFKDKLLTLLAQEMIEGITNSNHINDEKSKSYLKGIIDQQNDEKKRLAQKKKEEMLKMMQAKKTGNRFIKQIESGNVQDEQGPKCIVCHEGYTKKPTEILGMYVFSKKLKIAELTPQGNGFTSTIGYTTVTHSNFIHFLCHQNAYKADSNMKQPKKEWEGAIIRNDHTKCNNLFPVQGGKLPDEVYGSIIEKYFTILVKQVGNSDPDKVKVVLHDFKSMLKRLAYEESFSRDSQGGGPEHNMHLIPPMIQMIYYLLQINSQHQISHTEHTKDKHFTYIQERKIYEFLEQGLKLKASFLSKLEEEKKQEEIEEEEKFSEDQSSEQEDEGNVGGQTMSGGGVQGDEIINITLDQIAYYLTQALVFCQLPRWEQYKPKFLSIIFFTLSSLREDKNVQQQSKHTHMLTISRQDNENVSMIQEEEGATVKRKRGLSDNKLLALNNALIRLRPLLILIRVIDSLKQKWDGKRLGLIIGNEAATSDIVEMQTDKYMQRMSSQCLVKDSLQEVIGDCDELFREYKERMLKVSSVEEYLQDLGILQGIVREYESVENYIMSHF